jgi:hypothetical protein
MATQLKFVLDDDLAERFKRAVLAKHGKLELSKEGAEAIRLYLRERPAKARPGSLLDLIGSASSKKGRPHAARDKRALYED